MDFWKATLSESYQLCSAPLIVDNTLCADHFYTGPICSPLYNKSKFLQICFKEHLIQTISIIIPLFAFICHFCSRMYLALQTYVFILKIFWFIRE